VQKKGAEAPLFICVLKRFLRLHQSVLPDGNASLCGDAQELLSDPFRSAMEE
jgi:hypothetical protein